MRAPTALSTLLADVHVIPPDQLMVAVNAAVSRLGIRHVSLWLVDYEQFLLLEVTPPGVPAAEPLEVDTTLGGRAFLHDEVQEGSDGDGRRVWVPLRDGSERLGVVAMTVDEVDDETRSDCLALADVLAQLVVSKGRYTDLFHLSRRTQDMALAAEMQWELLPPLTMTTPRVVVSGMLEPAYEMGGDVFDYALNGDRLDLILIDAMGHGLPACLLATVAIGSFRHCRRLCMDLAQTYREIDAAIRGQFGGERFVTAHLAHLDLASGMLTSLNAGHPPPLLVRDGGVVGGLECRPSMPLGLGGDVVESVQITLQPGDRVVFYTDGVVEAHPPGGELFGVERLADMLTRESLAGYPPAETARRLVHAVLAHQESDLSDDATIVFVEFRQGGPNVLPPSEDMS